MTQCWKWKWNEITNHPWSIAGGKWVKIFHLSFIPREMIVWSRMKYCFVQHFPLLSWVFYSFVRHHAMKFTIFRCCCLLNTELYSRERAFPLRESWKSKYFFKWYHEKINFIMRKINNEKKKIHIKLELKKNCKKW
jgi:hypothetical protein